MPKIYIKPVINNKHNYYLNLIITNFIENLNSNSIEYEIAEYNHNDFNNILLEFVLNSNNNTESQGISICVPIMDPKYNRLANCISKNINRFSNTKIINSSNKSNIIINFGNLNSELDIKNLRNNTENISQAIIMSLDEYFGLPFIAYKQEHNAFCTSDVNIYSLPNLSSQITGNIIPGENINIIGQWEDWYTVNQNNHLGYIQTQNIKIM